MPALMAGATTGFTIVVIEIAFGALIFSDELSPVFSRGVRMILFGNFIGCLCIALMSGFRGAISVISAAPVIIMIYIIDRIDHLPEKALFFTSMMSFVIAAVITSLCFFIFERIKVITFLRSVPYPIACGITSMIGTALCLAALNLIGIDIKANPLSSIALLPTKLWMLTLAVIFGFSLYFVIKKYKFILVLPIGVVLAIVGFYTVILPVLNLTTEEAKSIGLLLSKSTDENRWEFVTLDDLTLIDWSTIGENFASLLLLALVSIIIAIVNLVSLEIAVGKELNWSREFRVTSLASLISGITGGVVSSINVTASLRSVLFGASTRMTGVIAALVILFFSTMDGRVIEYIPIPLFGGVIFFAAFALLDEGLVKTSKQLPKKQYAFILFMTLVTIIFGFTSGLVISILTIPLLLIKQINFSNIFGKIFRQFGYLNKRKRSTIYYSTNEKKGEGIEHILVLKLKGNIFFGNIYFLFDRLMSFLGKNPKISKFTLDFTEISNIDTTSIVVLSRFIQNTQKNGLEVSTVSPPSQRKWHKMYQRMLIAKKEKIKQTEAKTSKELVCQTFNGEHP